MTKLEQIKSHPLVLDVWREDNDLDGDGKPDYWVKLVPGYEHEDCNHIHETDLGKIMAILNWLELI